MWNRFWISWFRNAFWCAVSTISIIIGAVGGAVGMVWLFGNQEKKKPGSASQYFRDWL